MLLASITGSVTSFVTNHDIQAVFLLMLVDAVFPAASELVMVVGGAVAAGALGGSVSLLGMNFSHGFSAYVAISLAGTIGYLAGSIVGWAIGRYGGRPLLETHGRWFHLSEANLQKAERWFDRYENWAVLLGRITPVVRSFVSIPAGVFRVGLGRYTALTLVGSAIWAFALAGVGWGVGSSYRSFNKGFEVVEIVVVAGLLLAAAYWILRRRRSSTIP
jgi:membrane protein DedA with SNARE-associated domain